MRFNAERLYMALDRKRERLGLTWKDFARTCGVHASTFSRLKQGRLPDVENLAAILAFTGYDFRDFVDIEWH